MSGEALTGSRIRERRVIAGLKQADLARTVEISASYLNLIEHNRRRIGGRVLLRIAAALDVDPSVLTEGAEAQLLAGLRTAADGAALPEGEKSRAEEFAGRFPGWAELTVRAHQKIEQLERTVKSLSDRLAHDPDLAASMHEVLTTAAAIRSTAAILADDGPIEPQWLDRFHENLNSDSRRLAESAKALVQYFDEETERGLVNLTPEDEFDAFWDAHFRDLLDVETGQLDIDDLISSAPQLRSDRAKDLAHAALQRVRSDALALPRTQLAKAVFENGADPLAISRGQNVRPIVVMRRLSLLVDLEPGLVSCDRSGKLLLRQQSRNFQVPRFTSPPVDWALFEALSAPGQILSRPFRDPDEPNRDLICFATAEITEADTYNRAPSVEATMLVLPRSAST